ncbi:MAG: diguanylate cyclase [Reinekea sp.]|nr:diguanylate cyclase [Reinekea sp.]
MAKQDPKVEEWKEKFFEVSDMLEKQQDYDQLLERSLSRLALISQGLDPELDKVLSTLRTILRSNSRNPLQFEKVLSGLERSISQMDEKAADKPGIETSLVKLIEQISWPKAQEKAALALSKKVQKANNKALPEITEQLATLIQQGFLHEAGQAPQSFLTRLFGSERQKAMNGKVDLPESRSSETLEEAVYSSPEILTTLFEKLSLPREFNQQATTIREKIQRGIAQSELPGVINEIARLVSEMGAAVINEKKEYEAFLIDLMDKIISLDQHLSEFQQDEVNAYTQRRQIGETVEAEMNGLRLDVEDATELSHLRQSVSKRLENLNQHINHAHQADIERSLKAQEQIGQLNQRLQAMEEEAETLRAVINQAQEQATKDALTGIWNRQALNDMLEREYLRWQRYQNPLTIVFWDVDNFKAVNDRFGHSAGDVVLKTIAQIFSKSVRKTDFIARFGGEEFVGLFPETDLDDALVLTNKIRQIVEKTNFRYQGTPVPITASCGLAMFEGDDSIDDVFNRADKALYAAKNSGRNSCVLQRKQA